MDIGLHHYFNIWMSYSLFNQVPIGGHLDFFLIIYFYQNATVLTQERKPSTKGKDSLQTKRKYLQTMGLTRV